MDLLLITGPPAVGNMTVGREIAERSNYRLFHNHHTIEPLAEVFGYGTPPFNILISEFRRRVIEEAASHGRDLIFTFVWDMDDPEDTDIVERLVAPYANSGGRVVVVELCAEFDTRLARNRGQSRLAAKPTKRDLGWSDEHLRQVESKVFNSDPTGVRLTPADSFLVHHPHLRVDTTNMSAPETAEVVLSWLATVP